MKATFKTAFGYQGDAMSLPVANVATAITFYESVMGFSVTVRDDSSATLARDDIQMRLVENGGDPTQDGCFFAVDDIEAAFAELKANGLGREEAGYRMDRHGDTNWKVFFVVAPDGLCYCLGERQN